jgi:hypothetical protein
VVIENASFDAWVEGQRELFWIHHVIMHGALFNAEHVRFLTPLMQKIGENENLVGDVHQASKDVKKVERWLKEWPTSEEARVAHACWIASALIRGRYHQHAAALSGAQLVAHPIREGVGVRVYRPSGFAVYNTEELLVKIIIGSAFKEKTLDRRVQAWANWTCEARLKIDNEELHLPNAPTFSKAEEFAAAAAKRVGIPADPRWVRRVLGITTRMGISGLGKVLALPWAASAALGGLVHASLEGDGNRSLGDRLVGVAATRQRFLKLADGIPGRIERQIRAQA